MPGIVFMFASFFIPFLLEVKQKATKLKNRKTTKCKKLTLGDSVKEKIKSAREVLYYLIDKEIT